MLMYMHTQIYDTDLTRKLICYWEKIVHQSAQNAKKSVWGGWVTGFHTCKNRAKGNCFGQSLQINQIFPAMPLDYT